MRKSLILLLFAVCYLPLTALPRGIMTGEKDIRVSRTQWFDIIYSARSVEAAKHLAENADAIYTDVCAEFGCDKRVRYPVTLAPAREESNAFFTQFCANHIVIYDTPSSKELNTSQDSFLATFRHELTHAVTINMKGTFWRGVGHIFGDGAVAGAAILTKSHIEGAAVIAESLDGEGRLNDPYSFLAVKQAKIEGRFPHYADVYGARDAYPVDVYYSFGASFDDYIRRCYGMELYARFWYKCINVATIHQSFAFRSVFGITVGQAWQDFYESIEVDGVKSAPATYDGGVHFTVNNGIGALYDFLSGDGNGDVCYCDRGSGTVYLARRWADGTFDKRTKLFSLPRRMKALIKGVRLSLNGRFVAVNVLCLSHAARKAEVRIFDIKRHRWQRLPSTGLNSASVVCLGGEVYAVAVHSVSQSQSLVAYHLSGRNDRYTCAKQVWEMPLASGDAVYDVSDAGNGRAVCVLKSGSLYEFMFVDIATREARCFSLPHEGMSVEGIALASYTLPLATDDASRTMPFGGVLSGVSRYVFSYAEHGTLPRLAVMTLCDSGGVLSSATAKYRLDSEDVSGGVTSPVLLDAEHVLYVGQFFTDSKLLVKDLSSTAWMAESEEISGDDGKTADMRSGNNGEESSSTADGEDAMYIKYSPFDYLRGMWLPISIASVYDNKADMDKWLPFGATAMTAAPWFNGKGYALFSGGYLSGEGAIEGILAGGTDTDIFSYRLSGQAAVDADGFKQTREELHLSSTIPLFLSSILSFDHITRFIYDKDTAAIGVNVIHVDGSKDYMRFSLDCDYTYIRTISSITWDNSRQAGCGTYENAGVAIGVLFNTEYIKQTFHLIDDTTPSVSDVLYNPGLMLQLSIPRLLPFPATSTVTANLPITGNITLFPNGDKFLIHSETLTIFGCEIQKAIPFASIVYFNRIALEVMYTGKVYYTDEAHSWAIFHAAPLISDLFSCKMAYRDKIGVNIALTATPNYGAFVNLHVVIRGGIFIQPNKNSSSNVIEANLGCSLSY